MSKRKFQKLSNVEHVRKRTGMWLGQNSLSLYSQHFFKKKITADGEETYQIQHKEIEEIPAKLKCLDEACMNAVDEFNRNRHDKKLPRKKRMDSLAVVLSEDRHTITICDNGRGIPSRNAAPVFLHLMYGENFDDQARNEHIAGQNGVGISLVRIVSSDFRVDTISAGLRYRKTFTLTSEFIDALESAKLEKTQVQQITKAIEEHGELNQALSKLKLPAPIKTAMRKAYNKSGMKEKIEKVEDDRHGTTLYFKLNPIYFSQLDTRFSFPLLCQYLQDIAMTNPGLKLSLSFRGKEEVFFFKKGVEDILAKTGLNYYRLSHKENGLEIESFLTEGENRSLTWVNSNFASLGGSPVEYFENRLCDEVRKRPSLASLEKRLKTTASRNDVRSCFHAYHNFQLVAPRFKSQDKSYFINDLKSELRSAIETHLDRIIRKLNLLEKVKAQLERRSRIREMDTAVKEMRKTSRQFIPKYVPCANKKSKEPKTLFIAEGDSAVAGLRPIRNPALHGLFPLRGKPLNVRGMPISKALQNQEMRNIASILQLPIDDAVGKEKTSATNDKNALSLPFDRICIITDADFDGYAIRSLIMNFFFEYWPQLFYDGKIFFAEAPLYEVEIEGKKKQRRTVYCTAEPNFEKLQLDVKNNGERIVRKKRNKGLGETSPKAMAYTIKNCMRKVIIDNSKDCVYAQNLWFDKTLAHERRKTISKYAQRFLEE